MDEAKLKELMEKALEQLLGGEVKQFTDTLNEIKSWGQDNGRLKQAEDAIKQLEEQHKTALDDLDKKMQAAARRAYDVNGNYRGAFATEGQAREFALTIMSQTGEPEQRKRAVEVLQSDHKAFMDRYKDVTGEQAIIPHEHSSRMQRLVEDSSVFARHAFGMPMGSTELSFSRRVKGFRARKTKIHQKVSKQDMAVAPVNLTASDYDILTSYPIQLEADALVSIAELLVMEMGLGFSIALEEDGLIGDGTDDFDNEYGIVHLLKTIHGTDGSKPGVVQSEGAAGSGWAGITKNDLLKLFGAARFVRGNNRVAVCSNEFYWQVVAKIITDAGGVTRLEMEGAPGLQIFGVPTEISHVMPRESGHSQIPLIYGDIGLSSTLGRRQQLTVRTSRDVYFESKEVGVLATERYAINNHTLGDEDGAGPVVGLATPVTD